MVEFSLVSYEVIHSGIAEPVHRRTSQPTSTFECRSSVEKVRFGFDPFAEHPATANVEGRSLSLVGFVNHSPAARKPSLGRNLDGSKGAHVMRCDAVSGLQPYERYQNPARTQPKARRRESKRHSGLRGSFYRHKPPSGDVRRLPSIPFRGPHRSVEFVPELGAVVDVDEAETPQGAPVVGSDPVTEVRAVGVRDAERPSVACFTVVSDAFDVEDPRGFPVRSGSGASRLAGPKSTVGSTRRSQSWAATRIASDISAKSRDHVRTVNMGKSRRCQAVCMRHASRLLVRSPAIVV